MSNESSCVVKSSWNGSFLYLPDDESISYFPVKNLATEPKKETVLKKGTYRLYDVIENLILYVPKDNQHQLCIISPLGGFNKCLQTFDEKVRDFKVGREHVVVVLETKIVATKLLGLNNVMTCSLKEIEHIKNFSNLTPNLVALSYDDKGPLLACPSSDGQLNSVMLLSLNDSKVIEAFKAHSRNISNIALNYGATLVATVPLNSKTIRVYSTEGNLLKQFQQKEKGEVDFLKFNSDSSYLVSAKNSKHVLIYKLSDAVNQSRASSLFKGSGEKEFAYLKIPKEVRKFRVVGFSENYVGFIGIFVQDDQMNVMLFEINQQKGGECKQVMMFNAAKKDTNEFQL